MQRLKRLPFYQIIVWHCQRQSHQIDSLLISLNDSFKSHEHIHRSFQLQSSAVTSFVSTFLRNRPDIGQAVVFHNEMGLFRCSTRR